MSKKQKECQHPPKRYYSGIYTDEYGWRHQWVGCCDCGLILGSRKLIPAKNVWSGKDVDIAAGWGKPDRKLQKAVNLP